MINRARTAARVLLGRKPAGREITVLDDDLFIVSYPKSGNTWTRFLIGNLLNADDPVTFANVEDKVPDIYVNTDERLLTIPRPRVLKSHESFDPRYRKTVYIVRDPRDVALSYYYFQIKQRHITDALPFVSFLEQFVAGEVDGYGSWGENVGSWLGARRHSERFLLARYEDILADPSRELKRVATFAGFKAEEVQIQAAVERSSADRMRSMERQHGQLWKPIKNSRSDIPFVRAAKQKQWTTEMPQACARIIECEWRDSMTELGYL